MQIGNIFNNPALWSVASDTIIPDGICMNILMTVNTSFSAVAITENK